MTTALQNARLKGIAQGEPLLLGIDTGGTYTDAVLYRENIGVVAKAKALTTRHDLALGISRAVENVLQGCQAEQIGLVSMSTTLATNALVEGHGGRAGLVMIGFSEADMEKDGLRRALGDDPVIFLQGGHDVHGNEVPLDPSPLRPWLEQVSPVVSGFAVCGYFAVRNPAHEIQICEAIRAVTGLPVTASHHLSAKLGGPRRALTTLLNARLISLIDRLIAATSNFLEQRGIKAPLMVVRGDGALISASVARDRPIETILSGPAASLVGARQLTGRDNAIVSDIGGTTTDVALLTDGKPCLDPNGARVGGHRTMVEAIAMHTFGLGGDSEVSPGADAHDGRLRLGPRRLVPLSLAETLYPGAILPELERQLRQERPGRFDGRFAFATGAPEPMGRGLKAAEERLLGRLTAKPQPFDCLIEISSEQATLQRLVARGLAQICGFTPSDAAHVLGRQETWDREAAVLGAELLARRRDTFGQNLAENGEAISRRVFDALVRGSAESILETAFAQDGLDDTISPAHPLVQKALHRHGGVVRLHVSLDRPVIGLGASAGLYYSALRPYFGEECILPEHHDVANAIGAVAGQVQILVEAKITKPNETLFRVVAGGETRDFTDEAHALSFAEDRAQALAGLRATEAGADEAVVTVSRELKAVEADGKRIFVEATVFAAASGRPRLAG